MANTNALINLSGTTATLNVGKVTLDYNDTLSIGIGTGFPNTSQTSITKIEFWDVAAGGGKGNSRLATWPTAVPAGVMVAQSRAGVIIYDSDDSTVNQDYYYNVTANDRSTGIDYTADPELVIRKKVRTGGQSTNAAPDATP